MTDKIYVDSERVWSNINEEIYYYNLLIIHK